MSSIVESIYQMLGPNIAEAEDEDPERRVEMIFNRLDTVCLLNLIELSLSWYYLD